MTKTIQHKQSVKVLYSRFYCFHLEHRRTQNFNLSQRFLTRTGDMGRNLQTILRWTPSSLSFYGSSFCSLSCTVGLFDGLFGQWKEGQYPWGCCCSTHESTNLVRFLAETFTTFDQMCSRLEVALLARVLWWWQWGQWTMKTQTTAIWCAAFWPIHGWHWDGATVGLLHR